MIYFPGKVWRDLSILRYYNISVTRLGYFSYLICFRNLGSFQLEWRKFSKKLGQTFFFISPLRESLNSSINIKNTKWVSLTLYSWLIMFRQQKTNNIKFLLWGGNAFYEASHNIRSRNKKFDRTNEYDKIHNVCFQISLD